jgi:hypothetical protein
MSVRQFAGRVKIDVRRIAVRDSRSFIVNGYSLTESSPPRPLQLLHRGKYFELQFEVLHPLGLVARKPILCLA